MGYINKIFIVKLNVINDENEIKIIKILIL